MGGRVKVGYCIIGGVVKVDVKTFFDKLVHQGKFQSRSQAIGNILTEYMLKKQDQQKQGGGS